VGKKPKKDEFDLDRIDKLLAQFPDEEPEAPKQQGKQATPALSSGRPEGAASKHKPDKSPRASSPLAAWLRVIAGIILALAMTQWPYSHDCGFGLGLYLIAATGVLAAGAWAALYTWRASLGIPHLIALGVSVWGLTLAGLQVLPRVGYARAEASWTCRAQIPEPTPTQLPALADSSLQPAVPEDSTVTDSALTGDSAVLADSATQADSAAPVDSVIPGDTIPVKDSVPAIVENLTGG
jgi:hypothetical protein